VGGGRAFGSPKPEFHRIERAEDRGRIQETRGTGKRQGTKREPRQGMSHLVAMTPLAAYSVQDVGADTGTKQDMRGGICYSWR